MIGRILPSLIVNFIQGKPLVEKADPREWQWGLAFVSVMAIAASSIAPITKHQPNIPETELGLWLGLVSIGLGFAAAVLLTFAVYRKLSLRVCGIATLTAPTIFLYVLFGI
jgi:hypothetical protein